jgi:hypothetical protein
MVKNDIKDFKGHSEKRYKITIEHPDWEEHKLTCELEKIHLTEEIGAELDIIDERGTPEAKPLWQSGQRRVMIKLWEGCPTFEDFTTKD